MIMLLSLLLLVQPSVFAHSPADAMKSLFKDQKELQVTDSQIQFMFEDHKVFLNYGIDSHRIYLSMPGFWKSKKMTWTHPMTICFEFTVDFQLKQGKLDQIDLDPVSVDCRLPNEHAGNYLLRLVDFLAKTFSLKKVALVDLSEIKCGKNQESVSLTLLRTLQKGEGWYESRGYYTRSDQRLSYQQYVMKLKNYSLDQFEEDMSLYLLEKGLLKTKYDSTLHRIKDQINLYKSTHHDDNNFSRFASWLWDNDCSQYADLEDYFRDFLENKFENNPQWIHLVKSYPYKKISEIRKLFEAERECKKAKFHLNNDQFSKQQTELEKILENE